MPQLTSPIFTLIQQISDSLSPMIPTDTPLLGLMIIEDKELVTKLAQYQSLSNFRLMSLAEFLALEFSHYYPLAVLMLANDITSDTIKAISRCRDIFARHSLIFVSIDQEKEQDFFAFGFSKFGQGSIPFEGQEYVAWQFNLYDYKQLPDWFNSRFWANPENWNKFRW